MTFRVFHHTGERKQAEEHLAEHLRKVHEVLKTKGASGEIRVDVHFRETPLVPKGQFYITDDEGAVENNGFSNLMPEVRSFQLTPEITKPTKIMP